MATITHSAHNVERIVISSNHEFTSGDNNYSSREIVIQFEDGTEQKIDVHSIADSSIPVEVQ